MAIFADLAAETAERILLYVEDSWTLFNCLLVCQWFHAVAQRVYYRKVTFSHRTSRDSPPSYHPFSIPLQFFEQPKNAHLAYLVKQLVLQGDDEEDPMFDDDASFHWPVMDIAHLIDILQRFPNLYSFEMSYFKWCSGTPLNSYHPHHYNLKELHLHNFSSFNSHPHSLYSIAEYVGSPLTFIIGEGGMYKKNVGPPITFLPPNSSLVVYSMNGTHPMQSLSFQSPLVHLGLANFQHLDVHSEQLIEAFKASQHSLRSLSLSFNGAGSSPLGIFFLMQSTYVLICIGFRSYSWSGSGSRNSFLSKESPNHHSGNMLPLSWCQHLQHFLHLWLEPSIHHPGPDQKNHPTSQDLYRSRWSGCCLEEGSLCHQFSFQGDWMDYGEDAEAKKLGMDCANRTT